MPKHWEFATMEASCCQAAPTQESLAKGRENPPELPAASMRMRQSARGEVVEACRFFCAGRAV